MDGSVEWLDEFEGLDGCKISGIGFDNGFYKTFVDEFNCDESDKKGAYWSRDGVHWSQADENDLMLFDDLYFDDENNEFDWKTTSAQFDSRCYNNQIYFRLKGNLLQAAEENDIYAHYRTIATLPFDTTCYGSIACVGSVIHIFGSKGEWATAKIEME